MEYDIKNAGIAQLARAQAFQAWGRGFESRFPLQFSEPQGGVKAPPGRPDPRPAGPQADFSRRHKSFGRLIFRIDTSGGPP